MIYTEYQQVLLTQLQNNDKRIEEIKKEQEETGRNTGDVSTRK